MNIYKRLFCVLLVFVLLFVQFLPLHTVHATENNNVIEIRPEDYNISTLDITDADYNSNSIHVLHDCRQYQGGSKSIILRSDNVFLSSYMNFQKTITLNGAYTDTKLFNDGFTFDKVDSSKLFSKNSSLTVDITNIINYIEFTDNDSIKYKFYFNPTAVQKVQFVFYDISGNFHQVDADSFSFVKNKNDYFDLNAVINNIPTDVYRLTIYINYDYLNAYGYGGLPFSNSITKTGGFYNGRIAFNETTDNGSKGLLSNIISFLINIRDGIVDLPSKIASSIKTFFDNVVNAVTNVMNAVTNIGDLIKNAIVNLGTFLIDGIKGLFVPSEEDITEMKDRWTDLLRDRFGALYQTVELIDSYGKSFQAQEKNTITMPSIDLSLAGAVFTFGGWEVQVVPEGFDVLFNALKLIISIVCTIWFVNGLKNRFEKLVGGADNI